MELHFRKKNVNKVLNDNIEFLFMLFTMCFPTTYSFIRLVLLLIWVILTLINYNEKQRKSKKFSLYLFTGYILYNVFSIIYGWIQGTPGALRCSTVEIIWPLLFFVIGFNLNDESDFVRLSKYLLIIEFIICIWDIWYCLNGFGVLKMPEFILNLDSEYSFGNYGTFVQYTTNHMVTHIFMFPFTVAVFLFGNTIKKSKVIILIFLQLICILFSGRAALQLISLVLAIVLYIVYRKKYKKQFVRNRILRYKIMKIILGIIFFIIGMEVMGRVSSIHISGIYDYISNKFKNSFSNNGSIDSVRYTQFIALMKGWLKHPFLGNGTGSFTSEVIRDLDMPWAYELSYCALLFQKGLVGLLIFLCLIGNILVGIIMNIRRRIISYEIGISFVIGLLAITIANTVDPYMQTMGCMWMLYIPFALGSNSKRKELK